jgi:hypothetical protein
VFTAVHDFASLVAAASSSAAARMATSFKFSDMENRLSALVTRRRTAVAW